jgi:hypothetical protein
MKIYNVEPAEIDIVISKGDTLAIGLNLKKNDVDYDMSDLQLDMRIQDLNGTLFRHISSSGEGPGLIIAANQLNIYSTGFTKKGFYKYDIKVTDDTDVFTIIKGTVAVSESINE